MLRSIVICLMPKRLSRQLCRASGVGKRRKKTARDRKTGLSPMKPSRRAANRIKNPLPVPKFCPHDGGSVEIVPNEVIYGRSRGERPWAVYHLQGLCSVSSFYWDSRWHAGYARNSACPKKG